MLDTPFLLLSLFLFGLVFGSFANVVIWRFPRGESLSHPGSHCPKCETAVEWYDNVPVISWLLLRGRCRSCGEPISFRYPAVELLSAALWLLAGVLFGLSWQTLACVCFFYLLMIMAFIDAEIMKIPNRLVGLLFVLGVGGAAASQVLRVPIVPLVPPGPGILASPLVQSLAGALASAGIALGIAIVYALVRKTSGFGMGDVKLLAAIGAFLGLFGLLTLFLGSVAGAAYGIAAGRGEEGAMRRRFPFGPFLAAAAVVVTAFGPALWTWYVGLFR